MSTSKQDYEGALGCAHHDNQTNQEDDQPIHPLVIALLIIGTAVMFFSGVMFLIRM